MGINDRDYAREEPQGFNLGAIQWSGVGIVIVLNVVVFLVDMMSNWWIQDKAMLYPDLLQKPWNAWQLFTSGWLHDHRDLRHLVFNCFGIWIFGDIVENVLGKKRFLQFYCSSIILSGIGDIIAQQSWFPFSTGPHRLLGASGGVMALLALAAWKSPNIRMNLFGLVPIPLWLLAILYMLLDFTGYVKNEDNIGHSAHIAGALAGTLFYFSHWCLADLLPNGLISRFASSRKIRRSKLKVHRPSDDDDDEIDSRSEPSMTARMDAILEKISRVGKEGLTQAERDFMDKAADRLRARKGK